MHLFKHHPTATNGAPQTIAVLFAALFPLTMLLPIFQVTYNNASQPFWIANLLQTDAGFNVFALALILLPPLGVLVAMRAKSAWRIGTTLTAFSGLALVILAFVRLARGLHGIAGDLSSAYLGVGGYVLLVGYGIISLVTATIAIRQRNA